MRVRRRYRGARLTRAAELIFRHLVAIALEAERERKGETDIDDRQEKLPEPIDQLGVGIFAELFFHCRRHAGVHPHSAGQRYLI